MATTPSPHQVGSRTTLIVISLLAVVLIVLQVWATTQNTLLVEQIVQQIQSVADSVALAGEKTRQEVIALRIENELKAYFWTSLVSALGPLVAAFGALVGAWLAVRNYLEARDKERLDRAAGDLKGTLENLVSTEPRQRAVGVLGLQHFLTPDKDQYHLRALAALMTAARLEEDAEVLRAIRLAAEQAVRTLPEGALQQVSWQGAKLKKVGLAHRTLRALDLRDASIEDADLTGCDLSGASFVNARLNGARLDATRLHGTDLTYADLAGASLVGADLRGAVLRHAKVLGMDLARADLREAVFDADDVHWDLVQNWRDAHYPPGVLERLLDRYGPRPHGLRVLMLMWEIPPLVAGGTWTACYHMVRNLRRRGATITVVVPWDDASILPSPFGREVDVIALGMVPPRLDGDARTWSSYSAPPRFSWGSPYSSAGLYSPYGWGASAYSSYVTPSLAGQAASSILHLTEEFTRRLVRLARHEAFDIIHAHDWVTFEAAEAAAHQTGRPWIAHFHSTEDDRRPTAPNPIIERIERSGALAAQRVLVPSHGTAERVRNRYQVADDRVDVAPNPLSAEEIPPTQMGRFETKRVVFLGRLTAQKGLDRFAQTAAELRRRREGVTFWVYGAGEDGEDVHSPLLTFRGAVDWRSRGTAFAGASALLVPSRAEPFGMVVLEAMQHRVPVLYPAHAGVAEVIRSGIRIQPEAFGEVAQQIDALLGDWARWAETVEAQSREIAQYVERGYEEVLQRAWEQVLPSVRAPIR